ncbi:MAG TPA: HAMP domain-containing sensor histidine kinase [Bryobacteraceae bacterium]|nr:HAMP domain-containing sensor histidine kinase [Bryobacteraceae bacterium]
MRPVTFTDLGFDRWIDRGLQWSRPTVFTLTGILLTVVATADWMVGHISLGILYIIPMMTGALILDPLELAALALFCAFLRACFDYPASAAERPLRFAFASVSYYTGALFIAAVMRHRRATHEHLERLEREQARRQAAEDQLRLLAAGSPAAILTIDSAGSVIAANRGAASLFAIPFGQTLEGRAIGEYVPVLSDAIRLGPLVDGFRTHAQCTGRRANGEVFQADTWFSSYEAPEGLCLAAIVVDSSEEMRDREQQNLRQLLRAGRIATTAMAHEVGNLSAAISLLCAHLGDRHGIGGDEDLQGIRHLAEGIERIAAQDLSGPGDQASVRAISLRQVLDRLRIVIEPEWSEIHAAIRWDLPPSLPMVLADSHGLLQAFLNLARNSHRAVQSSKERWMSVRVTIENRRVSVRFEDSGPGIASPENLFQPFQHGAEGTGLGLYLSRAFVRSYGGELRYEPDPRRAGFVIDLDID